LLRGAALYQLAGYRLAGQVADLERRWSRFEVVGRREDNWQSVAHIAFDSDRLAVSFVVGPSPVHLVACFQIIDDDLRFGNRGRAAVELPYYADRECWIFIRSDLCLRGGSQTQSR